jgi:Ca2+-transporting ATPase
MIPVFVGWPPLLAPVHIIFLELIINPVCSIVFENEPERANLMRLPPRRTGARLLSNRALGQAAVAGALAAMLVLGLYAGLLTRGHDLAFARTLSFMALVACNVALIFVIRVLPQSGVRARAPQQNRYLWIVLGVTGAALLLLMTVPALARLFGLVALLSP